MDQDPSNIQTQNMVTCGDIRRKGLEGDRQKLHVYLILPLAMDNSASFLLNFLNLLCSHASFSLPFYLVIPVFHFGFNQFDFKNWATVAL